MTAASRNRRWIEKRRARWALHDEQLICHRCGQVKMANVGFYPKNASTCKACLIGMETARQKLHHDHRRRIERESQTRRRKRNPELFRDYQRAWRFYRRMAATCPKPV